MLRIRVKHSRFMAFSSVCFLSVLSSETDYVIVQQPIDWRAEMVLLDEETPPR